MVNPALLPLMCTSRLSVVDWTNAPAGLNGLVRFAERRNLVSASLPSHFNWPLTSLRRNLLPASPARLPSKRSTLQTAWDVRQCEPPMISNIISDGKSFRPYSLAYLYRCHPGDSSRRWWLFPDLLPYIREDRTVIGTLLVSLTEIGHLVEVGVDGRIILNYLHRCCAD